MFKKDKNTNTNSETTKKEKDYSQSEVILSYFKITDYHIDEDKEDIENVKDICKTYFINDSNVLLKGNWWRKNFGLVFANLKEENCQVFLKQNSFGNYYYYHPTTKKKIIINKKTSKNIQEESIAFFDIFPNKKLEVKDVASFILKGWRLKNYIIIIFCTFIITALSNLLPILNEKIYQNAVPMTDINPGGNIILVIGLAIALGLSNIFCTLLKSFQNYLVSFFGLKAENRLRYALISRIQTTQKDQLDKLSPGECQKRIEMVNNLSTTIATAFFVYGISFVLSVSYIIQIFQYTKVLIIPSILAVLLNAILAFTVYLKQLNLNRKINSLEIRNQGMYSSLLSGIEKIKISGAENNAYNKYSSMFQERTSVEANPPLIIKLQSGINTFITFICSIVTFIVVVKNKISPSEYIAFQTAYGLLQGTVNYFLNFAKSFSTIKPNLESIMPLLTQEIEIESGKEKLSKIDGDIVLENVSFKYKGNDEDALTNINFKIKKGETVAIFGTSGCGKTTLLKLLLGLNALPVGNIYYNNKSINKYDIRTVRERIGVVMQEEELINDTIFNNVCLNDKNAKPKEVIELLDVVGLKDQVLSYPMRTSTMINENYYGVSAGEKVKLAIARAIYRKPDVMLFDEITSTLDKNSLNKIFTYLKNQETTKIFFTKNISLAKKCDKVLLLEKGKIKHIGTFEEISKKSENLKKIVEIYSEIRKDKIIKGE